MSEPETPPEDERAEDRAEWPADSGCPSPEGVRLWGIYPFEWITLALVGGTVLFLRWQGLRIDWTTVEYTLYPMVPMLPGALVAGILLQALYRLVRYRALGPVREYLRRVWSLRWLTLWARLWVAAMLMTYAYFWLKVSVPLINERLWDQELWRLDVVVHGGLSPSIFLTQLFQDSVLTRLLDAWYGWWITSVFYGMAFFTAAPDTLFRRRFMLSCVFLWPLGAWFHLVLPSLGPIYAFPDVWNDLLHQMPSARGAQIMLWENYQKVLAGRTGPLKQFNPTRAIAAMPSLHVAAHGMFALWARRRERPLFALLLAATLLTVIGSVLTGWHYAVDAYAGLLLGWLCYRLAILAEPSGRLPARDEDAEDGADGPRQASGDDQ